ncbi:MAG: hypothetical protein ACREHF_12670 [Rhizomicrobium sp.]
MRKVTGSSHRIYLYSMILSAIIFAISHAIQLLVYGLIVQRSFKIDPTGFLVLAPYAAIEALVFFVVGYAVGYLPSRWAVRLLEAHRSGASWYVLSGMVMGLVFLPLCASIPFFLIPLSDEPGYLHRCFEFAIPMMLAGAFGGFYYWRCTHGKPGAIT